MKKTLMKKTLIASLIVMSFSAKAQIRRDTTDAFFLVSGIPDKNAVALYVIAGYEVWKVEKVDNKNSKKMPAGGKIMGNGEVKTIQSRLTKEKKPITSSIIIWQTIR